jgi:hypothetical protein
MPITLTTSGTPWAKLKVTTLSLGFNADGQSGEVKLKGLQLAADPENSVPGWLRIEQGSRDFLACAHNMPPKEQPTNKHVWTINLPIYNQDVMGDHVFHICDTSAAYLRFAEQLFNRCEPEFGKGTIPMIRIVDAKPRDTTKGPTADLSFEIKEWIPRPDAFIDAIRQRDEAASKQAASNGPQVNAYAVASGAEQPATAAGASSFGRSLDDEIPFIFEWR